MNPKHYLLIILFALVIVAYWWFWGSIPTLFRAVPNSAILLIESNDMNRTVNKLQKADYWQDLQHFELIQKVQQDFKWVDSLVLSPKTSPKRLLASLHITAANSYDYLLILPIDLLAQPLENSAKLLQSKGAKVTQRIFRNTPIYDVCLPHTQICFSLSTTNGVLLASINSSLVEEAVSEYSRWFRWSCLGRKVRVHHANSDASLFINAENLPLLSSIFLKPTHYALLQSFRDITTWSQFDIWLEKEAVQLNGSSILTDEMPIFEGSLRQKTPNDLRVASYMPQNTAFALCYAAQNAYYVARRHTSLFNQQYSSSDLRWIGDEWVYGFTEPGSADIRRESYVLLKMNDSTAARKFLEKMADKNANPQPTPTITMGKQKLHPIAANLLVEHLFGEAIGKQFAGAYYALVGDFVAIAGSSEYLQVLLEKQQQQHTLATIPHLQKNMIRWQTDNNALVYLNPYLGKEWLRGVSNPQFERSIDEKMALLQPISPLLLAFNREKNQIHTQGMLGYMRGNVALDSTQKAAKSAKTPTLLWNTNLDAPAASAPQLVKNDHSNETELMITDQNNTLYLLSKSGEVLWKRKFDEPILSKIYQIDYYGDKSLYYLLNTGHHLYLLDRQGNEVKEFTKKLPMQATSGLSCFKFADETTYSFFVPCGRDRIYGFEYSGKPLPGWTPRQGLGMVKLPIKYVQYEDKEVLAVMNDNGDVYLLDRRGKQKHKLLLGQRIIGSPQVDMRKNEAKLIVTTADSKTHLINVNGGGWTSTFAKLGSNADFITDNLVGDADEECVFMTGNKVLVYGWDKKLQNSYQFPATQQLTDVFSVPFGNTAKAKIGVLDHQHQQVWLLDSDNSIHKGFPIAATTAFTVHQLYGNEQVLVVGGTASNVVAYKVE
jgi:outer membrane protein assembly factor BamB